VKISKADEGKKFEVFTALGTYEFSAETEREVLQWTALIEVF
jgi:hypothetical protein